MIERRHTDGRLIEARSTTAGAAPASPTLIGYAALFDVETEIDGLFRERIAPGAFREALRRGDDVRCLFNHAPDNLLGRTGPGTLRLHTDVRGLQYAVTPPATMLGRDMVELVRRGDVSQSSFAFTVTDESWTHPAASGALPLRTLRSLHLFDVSIVTYPQYDTTSVGLRGRRALEAHAMRTPETAAITSRGTVIHELQVATIRRRLLEIRAHPTACEACANGTATQIQRLHGREFAVCDYCADHVSPRRFAAQAPRYTLRERARLDRVVRELP